MPRDDFGNLVCKVSECNLGEKEVPAVFLGGSPAIRRGTGFLWWRGIAVGRRGLPEGWDGDRHLSENLPANGGQPAKFASMKSIDVRTFPTCSTSRTGSS